MWWLIIPAAVVVFLAVVLVRAACFKPGAPERREETPAAIDEAHAVESLRQMVRCKTVSSRNEAEEDPAEFERFRALLCERYPAVHAACALDRVGKSGLLYHLKGKSAEAPCVFMAHYDVVPADEAAWQKPPFEGVIEEGVLWGRGTLDTKGTLNGVMEAAEALLKEGFVPANDWYFAFAGDEEIAGPTAPAIVEELVRRGVKPAMVLDEGGAVVEGVFPGVKEKCAVVGIAEKGMMDVEFTVKSRGGHASAPPPHTPVGVLAKAVCAVENKPFPRRLTKPVAEMFHVLGRRSTFAYRVIFANLWCFLPLLDAICKKAGGELNAMMRTTCAFTKMEGSSAFNVLPPSAAVGANLRLIGGSSTQGTLEELRRRVNDPDVEIRMVHGQEPSPDSRTDGPAWERLCAAIAETWPEALVSPYLMVACSDSRHYGRVSDAVYRFSCMELSKEERALIHGNNERIPLEKIVKTAQFYYRLMKKC